MRKIAQVKTNAMRILDGKKIDYDVYTYDSNDGKIDGVSVAEKVGKDPQSVYKTLVAQGNSKTLYVFIVPVEEELDLKKAAKATGEKKVDMIPVKDIQKHTGYIRGGCSPLGMKKHYKTLIDDSAKGLEKIIVSGGKIGLQIELAVAELASVTEAEIIDITK
ncbi:ybaK/ebsC protein [Desulforamulus reducens MI-1]|uniref:Cys-tRNA(Pro)/Cys-tRNA(Cys) deacylase n=1 Tax=Desulforamulus reducens (strain ATCC BAA-1160 / DSM 100696 / MI-1) TaxID=349161 RepID=A4J9H1_DESRM|nr:Cys-tRNA(Pro) deacylase [Desulforamulus reducens]ABO51724.1 ybaK/ebsC protein [Desulforamulus reducens MI-1]